VVEFSSIFRRTGKVRKPFGEARVSLKERRRYPRKTWLIPVQYAMRPRWYEDCIQNISSGGALIETRRAFSVGEHLSMCFQLPKTRKRVKITGEVVWVGLTGIGVKFKFGKLKSTSSTKEDRDFYDLEAIHGKATLIENGEGRMGRVKRKKVSWQPSVSVDVTSYRLYWSKVGEVSYDSDHADLGNATEVILPDDLPSFPLIEGNIKLGITAINEAGNESDIMTLTEYFNFTVPEAPQNLEVEDM